MKVLLTGGAGYIGSHTAIELIEAGHEVVIVDNFSNSKPQIIERLCAITGKEIPVCEADVADSEAMDKLFSQYSFDAVIHFAGLKAVGESCEKPLEYYRNNLDSTLTLLETMRRHGVKQVVFSSSATVYGNPETVPLVETMKSTGCTNPYGWTKYMIEQIMTDAASADSELSVVLLRYFNPVGAHSSGMIGEDPQGIPNNLMPFVAQVATGRRERLSVFGDDYDTPDGTGVRDYIHVVDLANGHVKAIEYASRNKGVEVFNLGTGNGLSVLDMVKAFEKASGVEVPYVIAPRRAGDIATCYADASKAERMLGWKATRTVDDMCADTWRWQSRNPKGFC